MVPLDDAISNEKTSGVDYNFALGDRYTKSDGIVYLNDDAWHPGHNLPPGKPMQPKRYHESSGCRLNLNRYTVPLLPITYYLLPITYYLLPITNRYTVPLLPLSPYYPQGIHVCRDDAGLQVFRLRPGA